MNTHHCNDWLHVARDVWTNFWMQFEVTALLSKLNAAETRARNAEHEVTEQQAKLIRLVEAVKEERKATKEVRFALRAQIGELARSNNTDILLDARTIATQVP